LWPGGFFRVSAEGRFGNDVNRKSGTFSPVNAAAILPADPDNLGQDMFAITELTMTQFLSKKFGLFAGLLNTASGDANDYAGFLRSKEHFQNLSFLANAVALRLVPNVALGGGVVLIPTDGILGTVAFINTEEAAGQDPFDNSNGGTLMTEWQLEHELADMPLHHVVAFGYGFDNDFFRLGEFPRLGIPPGGGPPTLEFSTKDDSWAAWYNGALQFWTDVRDKQRNAGVFVRFGYADEDTNPIQWNAAIGVGAVGAADFRPLDRFGIGLYRLKPVDAFPLPALGVDEETGFEAFYCYQITPAVALTADLQYVDSGLGTGTLVTNDTDNAWVGGLRLNLVL
jgi:porin